MKNTDDPSPSPRKPPGRETESLERKARQSLEYLAGRNFTDAEWREMAARLQEFASIVTSWYRADQDRKAG